MLILIIVFLYFIASLWTAFVFSVFLTPEIVIFLVFCVFPFIFLYLNIRYINFSYFLILNVPAWSHVVVWMSCSLLFSFNTVAYADEFFIINFINNNGAVEGLKLTESNINYIKNYWLMHLDGADFSNIDNKEFLDNSGITVSFLNSIGIYIDVTKTIDKTSPLITELYLKLFTIYLESTQYNVFFPNKTFTEIPLVFLSDSLSEEALLKDIKDFKNIGSCDSIKVKVNNNKNLLLLTNNKLYYYSPTPKPNPTQYLMLIHTLSADGSRNLKEAFNYSPVGTLLFADMILFDDFMNIVKIKEFKATSSNNLGLFIQDLEKYKGVDVEVWVKDKLLLKDVDMISTLLEKQKNVFLKSSQEAILESNKKIIVDHKSFNPITITNAKFHSTDHFKIEVCKTIVKTIANKKI